MAGQQGTWRGGGRGDGVGAGGWAGVGRARLPLRAGTVCASTHGTPRPVASNTRPALSEAHAVHTHDLTDTLSAAAHVTCACGRSVHFSS